MNMYEQEIRRLLKGANLALIILSVFLLFGALNAFKDWRMIEPVYNTISVGGQGEAVATPDVATFSFSVSADAKSVADAQNSVTKSTDAILADLKALGIEDKDIKTTDYSVYPKYSYQSVICPLNTYCPPGKQVIDGYTVSHSVQVKVRKIDSAGQALADVGAKGATNISGLSLTLDDPNKSLNEARAKAIDDARAKAQLLAHNLGVRLVRIVGYSDTGGGNPYPIYNVMAEGAMSKAGPVAPTIPTGENKTTVNVTVTYEIR